MGRRNHYHVYVVELSKDVLLEGKFRKCNPDYVDSKPCVYVGMTGLTLGNQLAEAHPSQTDSIMCIRRALLAQDGDVGAQDERGQLQWRVLQPLRHPGG